MLALGIVAGAAIGPSPDSSLAGAPRFAPLLLPSLATRVRSTTQPAAAGVVPPAASRTAAPRPAGKPLTTIPRAPATRTSDSKEARSVAQTPGSPSPTSPSASETPAPTPGPIASKKGKGPRSAALPAITSAWLIALSPGWTFANVLTQRASAPYLDSQLVPAGTLLSTWSPLAGAELASAAVTVPTSAHTIVGQETPSLSWIAQTPCLQGSAAGTQCAAPGTPGSFTAADGFLKQTVQQITATPAYREHGLIVITFGAAPSPAVGIPPPAASSGLTLTAPRPPAGVLLLSPFVRRGIRPLVLFDPTSPRKSLEGLLTH